MKEKGGRINWLIRHMMLITGLVLAVLLLIRGAAGTGLAESRERLTALLSGQADAGLEWIWRMNYPAAGRAEENETKMVKAEEESISGLICRFIFGQSPLYRYLGREEGGEINYKEEDPAFAGYLESGKFYEEHQYLMYDGGEETGAGTMEQAGTTVLAANGDGAAGDSGNTGSGGNTGDSGNTGNGENTGVGENAGVAENAGINGNAAALPKKDDNMTCAASVLPLIGKTYRKEQLADYDYMMKHFYSVHTSATAGRDLMKADEFLAKDFTLEGSNDKPQILIYHTHSQEEFSDYGPDNKEATVIGIGNYLTELLTQKYGFSVIHHTGQYDVGDRDHAYAKAGPALEQILAENKSIEVVIDLHRDGVGNNTRLVTEQNGMPMAQIMFFNGLSRTTKTGDIEYLYNPYIADNLAISFQMQLKAAEYYPGFTRRIYLKGYRYNMHYCPKTLLIEVGAQTNTLAEAKNAMVPLADLLNKVLTGQQ